MNTNTTLSLLAASVAALALSSCVMPMDEYYNGGSYGGGGYSGGGTGYGSARPYYSSPGYADNDFYYYDGGAYPSYYNRGYGSYTAGYSYYRGSSTCPICHHSPCSGHNGRSSSWSRPSSNYSHSDHDDHHSTSNNWLRHDDDHRSSSSNRSSSGPVLYTHKSQGANGGASGAHSKEWFTSRGYSPARLEKTDNHSSNNKSNDDDKKHHKH